MRVCVCARARACVFVCARVRVCVCTCACLRECVHACVCMRPCVHVHLSTAHAVSVSIMCLTDWALPESMCPRLYVRASTRATFFLFFFFFNLCRQCVSASYRDLS